MNSVILGIGKSQPEFSITLRAGIEHATKLCCVDERQARALQRLYEKTTIERRSCVLIDPDAHQSNEWKFYPRPQSVSDKGPSTAERVRRYNKEAGALAFASSTRALESSAVTAGEITHLVTVSCTGFGAPGFDIQLMKELGLKESVYRTHLGFMGCHGAMNGIRVADAFCAADPEAVVLLNATELCSLHFQYGWQSDNLRANSLFADGSASLVIAPKVKACASACALNVVSSRSFLVPNSGDLMTWTIGDHGFHMTLDQKIADAIASHLPGFIREWLKELAISTEIEGWAVHPGGPRILETVESALNLNPNALDSSRQILTTCGNMSSPTVLFILEKLRAERVVRPLCSIRIRTRFDY